MVKNVIFMAVFLFGYTVQAITGFAGNIFCMPVGTLTLGLQSSVSILNATGFLACTVLAALNIRSIHWRELGKIVGVMLPFVVLGAWLDSVVPLHALLKIYGLVILAVGIKNLVQRKQSFLPEWALWGVLKSEATPKRELPPPPPPGQVLRAGDGIRDAESNLAEMAF